MKGIVCKISCFITEMALSISDPYEIPTVASARLTVDRVNDRILDGNNFSLGILVTVPSNYRILQEKVPVSRRVPDIPISGSSIVSPCFAGFSTIKNNPEIKLETTD